MRVLKIKESQLTNVRSMGNPRILNQRRETMAFQDQPLDFETELPGDWPPCERCASTTRVAVATMSHRNVAFRCGNDHNLQYQEPDGRKGLWIRHEHFWQGGIFEDLIPMHFIGLPKAKQRDRKFDINEERRTLIRGTQAECVSCGQPPMTKWHDKELLLEWLLEYHKDVYDAMQEAYRSERATGMVAAEELFNFITVKHPDVMMSVTRKVRDSMLEADHTIPVSVLAVVWPQWSVSMRRIATSTLAFGYCRPDNRGKSNRLPTNEEILRLHVQYNHDGSQHDAEIAPQWGDIQRILSSLDAYRSSITPIA